MWILILLFFLSALILGWVLFGYYIWLFFLGILKKESNPIPENLENFPSVSLIIPTYNEETFILKKIENVKSLAYPETKLQVIFVDGGSEDRTEEIIEQNKTSHMEFLRSRFKGKVNQLNFALKHVKGEFIFVTDSDGLMSSNCIEEALKEFASDKNISLVGVYSYPKSSYELDRYYWLTQNSGRLLETRAFTSSIVIAVCYSFRKGLLDEFPQDVVADDIYISYLANNSGRKVSYVNRCHAEEMRGPANIRDFLGHKFRKSNAFLKESLRSVYRVSEMSPVWRIMFLTKISQIVLLPWVICSYIVLGGSLISLQRWEVFLLGSLFLLLLLLFASRLFLLVRRKGEEKFSLWIMAKTFILSNFVLLVSGLSFIFFRQDSSYKKTNAS